MDLSADLSDHCSARGKANSLTCEGLFREQSSSHTEELYKSRLMAENFDCNAALADDVLVHKGSRHAINREGTAASSSVVREEVSTCVPGSDTACGDLAQDVLGSSKGRNRRKANQKARLREGLPPQQLQKQPPRVPQKSSKGCQTDKLETKELQELRGRIVALEQLAKQQGEIIEAMRGLTMKAPSSTPGSMRPPKKPADMETRVSYLERMEEEHSRMIVLKCRADSENYDEMKEMKMALNVLSNKVDFCLDVLDDESDGNVEEEEEEELEEITAGDVETSSSSSR